MLCYKKSYSLEQIDPSFSFSENSLNTTEENCVTSSDEDLGNIKQPAKHNPHLGFFYTFLSSVFFTLTSVFVKKLEYINPGQLSLVRNAGIFAGVLPIAIYSVKEVIGPKEYRLMLLFRGFFGATALYLNITAYRYLPLAEAAIVMSTTPILTAFVAYLYLKETCGLLKVLCLVISLCGVLLSVRIPDLLSNRNSTRFDTIYLGGLASAFGCVICYAFLFVTLRKMKNLHFSIPMLYVGFLGMIENGVINHMTATFAYFRCGWDQVLVILIGIFGFLGNGSMILGLQSETAGIVAVARASIDIVLAMIFQIIFFDNDINIFNIIGAFLVMISVSMIGINKWLCMLPEESKVKRKLKWLL